MKVRTLITFVYALTVVLTATYVPTAYAVEDTDQVLIFNEIRLGGTELVLEDTTSVREYVTIFNLSDQAVTLSDWRIEYAKSTFDETHCGAASWADYGAATVVSVTLLDGLLEPHSLSAPIVRQLNDTGSGSIRLLNLKTPDEPIVHDLIGWGADAPCVENVSAPAPTTNKSMVRYLSCENDWPLDTDDNSKDLYVVTSNPQNIGSQYNEVCPGLPDEDIEENPIVMLPECDGLSISEILPNPEGTDKNNEFIEIYNPTSGTVRLDDCILRSSGTTKDYAFPQNTEILSGEYRAYYDEITGLTLANAAGGSVMLIGTSNDFVVDYPPNLKSNEAWALIDGIWQISTTPTPDSVNSKPEVLAEVDISEDIEPCPDGKYRSLETNRCRNIQAVVTQLVPCKTGQIRSLETNRCRNVASIVSSLVPCRPGQERNPETNRCRNIVKAATESKPCEEGFERNPETNRCRKLQVAKATAMEDIKDDDRAPIDGLFLAAGSFGVIGYGFYEYRRDMTNFYNRVRSGLKQRGK